MSTKSLTTRGGIQALERVLIQGDLAPLDETQRLQYVKAICSAIGVSILFRPFDYIKLQGKVTLYANRSCTEQLRKHHKVSISIVARERIDGLYVVTARASMPGGKTDEAIGAVNIKGLTGENLANAMMKAETKAKRRVTLSICGLGMLDEVEAKALAEREAKIVTNIATEKTTAKLELTTERPAFEAAEGQGSSVNNGPASDAAPVTEYRLKTGRSVKGKPLSQIPLSKLTEMVKWIEKLAKEGALHPDVASDELAIKDFLAWVQLPKPPDDAA